MARSPSTCRAEAGAAAAAESKARFIDAYNRLQAAAAASGVDLPIPEIVVIGGQSDGKSSLLEAFLGFRFNVCGIEMCTRRPLTLQMVNDPTAIEPRFRFQEEDSEEYGSPMDYQATAIADLIKHRTKSHLLEIQAAVSSKPIITRVEYAYCSNLTIIDTPGLVIKANEDEPESTPDEIRSMVLSLAAPPHRLVLFLQQSSVEWCSSIWLDTLKEIDPTFRRTMIVISKFDNRLKEFEEGWEVNRFLSAKGYLGDNTHLFFVALPKDHGTISNEEFRKKIYQVDEDVLRDLRKVSGGFDEEKYGSYIGFGCLQKYLESELEKRYKEAAPAIQELLEQRCTALSVDLTRLDSKLEAVTGASRSRLRSAAMLYTTSICTHLLALLNGAADPAPQIWGRTTEEEQMVTGIVSWPGVEHPVKPDNYGLKLYGAAAFVRVMHEFCCATKLMECPQVSVEKVANILSAHAGSKRLTKAAAEMARAAARSCFAPLIDTACDRLAFVLESLFELAMECYRNKDSQYHQNAEDMDGYVGFIAALRWSYCKFVKELSKQCKQIVHHHLDLVTSPCNDILSDADADDMCSESGSPYSAICTIFGQYFSKMINALIERNVPSAFNSGFLTPWRERLCLELGVQLFAVSDDKFMEMFVTHWAVDNIRNKRQSLVKHQETLLSCLDDFKNISQDL